MTQKFHAMPIVQPLYQPPPVPPTLVTQVSSPAPAPSLMWSAESERNLICAALTEDRSGVIQEISSQITSTDFFEPAHQNIWRCRASLSDAGVAHDAVSVIDSAKRLGLFIGGPQYLMELLGSEVLKSASDGALRASANRVKSFSTRRILQESLKAASTLSEIETTSNEDVMTYVTDTIENIRRSSKSASSGPMSIAHYAEAVLEQLLMRMEGGVPDNTVTTGSDAMDKLSGQMTDGDLVILAARPSMGKTAVSLFIAQAAASAGARHVLIFSTEQGGVALTRRMIASTSRVGATNIKNGQLTNSEVDRFHEGASTVSNLTIEIDETSEITLPEIRAKSRLFAQRHAPAKILIIVDYLQRIAPHRPVMAGQGHVIVGEISTGFKNLAKELKCPLVALAQLSRKVEDRANKRPLLSDLAESGKIEQDADIIWFLYRDEYYNANTKEPGITEFIAAKNREGAIGTVKLATDKQTQHYQDLYC